MRIRSRIEVMERRLAPHGECGCNGGNPRIVVCRDPSAPRPPPTVCARCGRPEPRVIVPLTPLPGDARPVRKTPAYQPCASLMDFYTRAWWDDEPRGAAPAPNDAQPPHSGQGEPPGRPARS